MGREAVAAQLQQHLAAPGSMHYCLVFGKRPVGQVDADGNDSTGFEKNCAIWRGFWHFAFPFLPGDTTASGRVNGCGATGISGKIRTLSCNFEPEAAELITISVFFANGPQKCVF
jgi:hypothetical protein